MEWFGGYFFVGVYIGLGKVVILLDLFFNLVILVEFFLFMVLMCKMLCIGI